LETTMLHLALTISRLEADYLHIPPALRFFTAGGDAEELFNQAFIFTLAPYFAFIIIPLIDAVLGGPHLDKPRGRALLRHGRLSLQFLLMWWVIILVVTMLSASPCSLSLVIVVCCWCLPSCVAPSH
jgi:hypothetical protein